MSRIVLIRVRFLSPEDRNLLWTLLWLVETGKDIDCSENLCARRVIYCATFRRL